MRPAPEDVLAVLGLALVGVGLGLVYVPVALVVVGALLLAGAWMLARSR